MASNEAALLELATKDDSRDILDLSDNETLILQLYDQIQEQELERALLEEGMHRLCLNLAKNNNPANTKKCPADSEEEPPSLEDVEEQLPIAERELLEARATYTVRQKVIETVLTTDPMLKSVHSTSSTSPAKR